MRGVNRKVTLLPATIGVAETTVLDVITRSAPIRMAVFTVPVLSLVSASEMPPVLVLTVAVLVITPLPAVAVATMATAGMGAPAACAPARSQVTVPALWLQDQPVPLADTNRLDGGSVFTSVKLPAAFGPSLEAVSV